MKRSRSAAAPFGIWMFLFTVVPLGIVLWFAFTDKDGHFTFGNLSAIVDYAGTFGLSIGLGAIATVLCLVLAYPLAYSISRAGEMCIRDRAGSDADFPACRGLGAAEERADDGGAGPAPRNGRGRAARAA